MNIFYRNSLNCEEPPPSYFSLSFGPKEDPGSEIVIDTPIEIQSYSQDTLSGID